MNRFLSKPLLALCLSAFLVVLAPAAALAVSDNSANEVSASEKGTELSSPTVAVLAHSTEGGWVPLSLAGYVFGDPDESTSCDQVRIVQFGASGDGSLSYQVYVEGQGWSDWVADGESAGVEGETIGGIRIKLTGDLADSYDVYYRVYSQSEAWMGWACNGQAAGTPGFGYAVGSVQVSLVAKGGEAPGSAEGHVRTLPARTSLLKQLDRVDSSDGLTVFGGTYDLDSEAGTQLQEAFDALADSGYTIDFALIDLSTGKGLAYHAEEMRHSASTLKGPYVCALNKYRTSSALSSWKDTMESTIVVSSNEDYALLRNAFGSDPMARYMDYAQVDSFSAASSYTYLSTIDLAKLWVANYYYLYEDTNENSAYCRNIFDHSSHSVIYRQLGENCTVNSKPGWLSSNEVNGPVQNDAGIVFSEQGTYIVAFMSSAFEEYDLLGDLVVALDAVHADMVG